MKIKIDKDKCIGCGTCAALAPDVFEINGEFKAVIKDGADLNKDLKDIIQSCPVEAITLEE